MQNVSGRTLVGLRFWNQACPFLFSSVMFVVQTCLQVDDDGESYWVFESRDVRLRIKLMSRRLLLSAFQTGKPCGFKVYSSALSFLLVITNISPVECFGYDHRCSTSLSLIRFSVQIALYVFPLLWAALLIVSLLKLGFASVQPISII